MRNPYKPLEKRLGYRFRKRRLLEAALTHRSFRFESVEDPEDNQRLEFLGDAVLGLVTGAHLYKALPEAQEGELTRVRSRLTNTRALAKLAGEIDLGSYLRLGRGEQQTGGHKRVSNLGDALEAVLGAAYLDGGIKAVDRIFRKVFLPEIEPAVDGHWHDNPKGALQEYCQSRWKSSPRYRILREEGPPHSRVFTVQVHVHNRVMGEGAGPSKREAEMDAARAAMERVRPRH